MKVTLVGVDLAKTIFQTSGVNQVGKATFLPCIAVNPARTNPEIGFD